jgi:DNA repair exonuclease SbcCD nuclease subunit
MRGFTFLHVADLHLDSPFVGLRSAPAHVVGALQQATFAAYDRVIETALKEQVDFVLIAGDIYDGKDRSLRAQLRFRDGLARLATAGIESFVVFGNHDPLAGWSAQIDWPQEAHRFGSDAVEAVPAQHGKQVLATVYGVSHGSAQLAENLVPRFGRARNEGFAIGLLHANVEGIGGHENYAPCRQQDLELAAMDYWALGHVHDRRVLRDAGPTIVYPGNIQARSRAEGGERYCCLVTVDGGVVSPRFVPVDAVRWQQKEVSIAGLADDQALLDHLDDTCREVRDVGEGRPAVCTVTLIGSGPVHHSLDKPGYLDGLLDYLQTEHTETEPFVWVDRLQVVTTPELDREERKKALDFAGELLRIVDEIRSNPEQIEGLKRELAPLQERLQRSLRMEFPAPTRDVLAWLDRAETICAHLLEGDRL